MILFLDEDRAYLSWIAHHRRGFVLDGKRKPTLRQLVLHRATCPAIKSAPSRRIHWTTGAKLKACAVDREQLAAWVAEQTSAPLVHCADCRPGNDVEESPRGHAHLARLSRDILDYVLDAAVIHLEHEFPPYRLTIGDIAACFAKTPGQLSPAIRRLVDEGLVECNAPARGTREFVARQIVLPTKTALRTLVAFQNESDDQLAGELAKLQATG